MRIAFPEEVRRIDRDIIERGMPSLLLMENAARSVFEEVLKLGVNKGVVLCGSGNNGGDGYAVARLLLNRGLDISVIACYPPSSEDCRSNAAFFSSMGGSIFGLQELSNLEHLLRESDLVVDGIFGTGFHGKLENRLASLIELVNSLNVYRIAIDIPSGVSGFDGSIAEQAFMADKTVTFATGKTGQFIYPGREYCGEVVVKNEGFSSTIIESHSSCYLIDDETVVKLLPLRPPNSYKGTYGRVLIIGGSEKYSGAPLLSAIGAMFSGCGMVYTYTPPEAAMVIRNSLPESISLVSSGSHFSIDDLPVISELVENVDSVVIGPGIGREEDTVYAIQKLFGRFSEKSFVVDADALYALSKDLSVLSRMRNSLTTPHQGEFRILSKSEPDLKSLMNFCRSNQCMTILKGASSVLCDQNGRLDINVTGTTGLAKGGSGDLLSGTIGSFAAQTGDMKRAAILGMYFMGKASELMSCADPSKTASSIGRSYSEVFSYLEELRG